MVLQPVAIEEGERGGSAATAAGRAAWFVVFAILLLGALAFTVVGTQARVNDRFPVQDQWPPLSAR